VRGALLDLGLGRVRHPWGMPHFTSDQRLNVISLPFSPGRVSSISRYPQSGFAILLSKHLSFARTLQYTSFLFSRATLFKALARCSTFHGSSKNVYTSARCAQLKRLSSNSVMYECVVIEVED
jgi:Flp pilus assembly CpaE family ATPase